MRSSSRHCSGVTSRVADDVADDLRRAPSSRCCSRWISGSVTLPSRRSPPIGLPSASASPVKSSRSSTSWNAMPRLKPYSRSACSLLRRDLAEHAADLRAAAEQVRRLAADDVEVLVFGDVGVAVLGELVQLAFDHPQRDVAEQPDDVERVVRQRHRHRLDVEVVAEQHGDVVAPPRVHRQAAAPQIRVVDDVVVDERRGVDELDDRRVEHRAIAGVAGQARRHQQHRRPDRACRRSSGCTCRSSGSARPATATWRANSRSTFSRSSRIGSKICDESERRFFHGGSRSKLYHGRNRRVEVRGRSAGRSVARAASCRAARPARSTTRDDVRRLVALAAVRHRREERAVGFDQAADRAARARADLAQVAGLRKREDAGQRDVEAELERRARQRGVAGEAVEHAAQLGRRPPRAGSRACPRRLRACG